MKPGHLYILGLVILLLTVSVFVQAQELSEEQAGFTLEDLLNTEISSAAKYDQKASDAPASVSIISSEDIERYGYETVGEVLQSMRGFYTSYDRNYLYVGARGFSRPTDYNNRLLLLMNGTPVNENVYGSSYVENILALSMEAVERIEVVRGPGSVLYGTNAMFAVINVVTKSGNKIDGLRIATTAGSQGYLGGHLIAGKLFKNNLDLMLNIELGDIHGEDVYYPEYDDPATNYGIAKDLDWNRFGGLYAMLSYKNLTVEGKYSSREKGIPTGAFDIVFNQKSTTLDEFAHLRLKWKHSLSAKNQLTYNGYWGQYNYDGLYPYADIDEEGNEYVYDTFDRTRGKWFMMESQLTSDIRSNNRFILGIQFQNNYQAKYRAWDESDIYTSYNSPYNIFSFYLQNEYHYSKDIVITAGVRSDRYSNVGNAFTPRVALVANPFERSTLKLMYGEAFRAPSVDEIYYEDPFIGQITSNNLRPEEIRTFEIGWEQGFNEGLYGYLSVYNNNIKNLIDLVPVFDDSIFQNQNISVVRALGVEFELQTRRRSGFTGYASLSLQRSKDRETNSTLSNSPLLLVKGGVSLPVFSMVYVSPEIYYETERQTLYNVTTDPYFITSLTLSTRRLFERLKLTVKMRNLFDKSYATPGGYEHQQAAILQDGRSVFFKLSFGL